MIEALKQEIAKHGDKAAIIPAHRLQDLRQNLENLKANNDLNHFQQFIVNDLYSLDAPPAEFEIRSILIVASPSPASVNLTFHWEGKSVPVMLPASYVDKNKAPARIGTYLIGLLGPLGYHVLHAPRLPHKLLAVRSGLGAYGRNNICFVEGMGSFLNLSPFYSDIPCVEDTWQDIRAMDLCQTCQACLQNCPTAAILPTRFLINNEHCLTYFNEAGGEWNFPEWIDPSSHHTLYGCLRCQAVCPVNKPYLNAPAESLEFTDEETTLLLEGKAAELLPESLKQKVDTLAMAEYLSGIPRNLRAIFNNLA